MRRNVLTTPILLAFALAGCASKELPPLKVLPVNPEHPVFPQPPAELMEPPKCVFLPLTLCPPQKPNSASGTSSSG